MSAALTSRASLPPMREASSRPILKLSLGSSKSVLAFVSLLRSFLHCKLEELGGHLEQVSYVHAIWRVQLQSDDVI